MFVCLACCCYGIGRRAGQANSYNFDFQAFINRQESGSSYQDAPHPDQDDAHLRHLNLMAEDRTNARDNSLLITKLTNAGTKSCTSQHY